MRCPRCGYISFDRPRSCGKCSFELTEVAEQLRGTVSKAKPPFFLGAAPAKQNQAEIELEPVLHEEEEPLVLDELDIEIPPADEESAGLVEELLDLDVLEEQPLLAPLSADIASAELALPQEEQAGLALSLENEQGKASPAQEDDLLMGIEFSGFAAADMPSVDEQENVLDDLEDGVTATQDTVGDEEIDDLSTLLNFDDSPGQPATTEKAHDGMELFSFEDAEDDDPAQATAKGSKKTGKRAKSTSRAAS